MKKSQILVESGEGNVEVNFLSGITATEQQMGMEGDPGSSLGHEGNPGGGLGHEGNPGGGLGHEAGGHGIALGDTKTFAIEALENSEETFSLSFLLNKRKEILM
jgi:hypothetical protein